MGLSLIELADGFACHASSEMEARFIYQEIFEAHSYDLPGLLAGRTDPFIVDIGANIGLFCIYARRTHPAARIMAFEPAPENLQALRMNLELHRSGEVEVHPLCLGAQRKEAADFTYYPGLPGNSTLHPEEQVVLKSKMSRFLGEDAAATLFAPCELNVRVERLSYFLAEGREAATPVDLVKIDVEGAELEVLDGIDDADWPRIRNCVIEVHDSNDRLARMKSLLRGRGMTVSSTPAPFMEEELPYYYVTATRP
ncbi:FkbM family methyltransferase [Streptomyces stramineus]|uniref:Methyltransferase FkbM domain-containing protein n=1 Tax=Streptomyces stramineus TaxID=173861 RepID=A0ABN1AVL3_9ACTN